MILKCLLIATAVLVIVGIAVLVLCVHARRCPPSPSPRETYTMSSPSPVRIVPYDAKQCKADMSHCYDVQWGPDCQLSNSTSEQTQPFFGYKVNIYGTDPSVQGQECGFKYSNKRVCSPASCASKNNWNDSGRPVWVYFPNNVLTAPGPNPGHSSSPIPYVIYYSFEQWNDKPDFSDDSVPAHGIYSADRGNPCTFGDDCTSSPMSAQWMQLQLQSFLAAGYAVVLTTMIADDSYMYMNCTDGDKDTPIYSLCWNDPANPSSSDLHNPDYLYLNKLFTLIHDGNLFNPSAGVTVETIPADPLLGQLDDGASQFIKNGTPKVALSPQNCGLIGYSVGAQMVSRSINDFPQHLYWPKIGAAAMVSGGSMHCYEYCDGDDATPRGVNGARCKSQPSSFGPCWNKETLGCCPVDLTEPYYDDPKQKGNYKDHPPVILVQTDFDYYADPRASENYYAKMQKEAPGRSQIVRGACGNHDLFPTALLPVLTFFVKHMTTTKFSNLVS
jgi:hypothetical protein